MIAEDVDGNAINAVADELKINVSGFKLRTDQKRGIKNLKCILVEESDEFDVLVVNEAKRTIKLLIALMKRKPIVSG